jgi:hypothetical protein
MAGRHTQQSGSRQARETRPLAHALCCVCLTGILEKMQARPREPWLPAGVESRRSGGQKGSVQRSLV